MWHITKYNDHACALYLVICHILQIICMKSELTNVFYIAQDKKRDSKDNDNLQ